MVGYLRRKGSESGNRLAATLEAQQAAIELAHGLLWGIPVDTRHAGRPGDLAGAPGLSKQLDGDGHARGIALGRKAFEAARDSRKKFRTDARRYPFDGERQSAANSGF
jgi:hypothetical protein